MAAIKTRIVKIGNSQGIRIPKVLLQEAGLTDEVELVVGESHLVVRPLRHPRAGWAEQFQEMASRGDDVDLLVSPTLTSWDETEWEW
jgi:antitoxin MazE